MSIQETKAKLEEAKQLLQETKDAMKGCHDRQRYQFLENKIIAINMDIEELEQKLKQEEGAAIMRATRF